MIKLTETFSKHKILISVIIILILAFLILFFLVGKVQKGVEPKDSIEKLESCQGTYIGEASKVNKILENLLYAEYKEKIELQTNHEPYGLTVHYKTNIGKTELTYNTIALFKLIPNLETITYQVQDGSIIENRDTYMNLDKVTIKELPQISRFKATILEVGENYLLVQPVDNSEELKASNKITLSKPTNKEWKIGQQVTIIYTGIIMESYPAQIVALQVEEYQATNQAEIANYPKSVQLYLTMIDDIMVQDTALNHDMQYIAIDLNTFIPITENSENVVQNNDANTGSEIANYDIAFNKECQNMILNYCKKYHDTVFNATMDELKEQGKVKEEGNVLDGILIRVSQIEKLQENHAKVRLEKFRSGTGAIFPLYNAEYKDGKWDLTIQDTMISKLSKNEIKK